ncbi:MAG: siderophore-interacting protein [Friedmanniella sp.]|nr:siderophore-interacting protein [Friedmanniella sp.]
MRRTVGLTPDMVRVTFTGDDLRGLADLPFTDRYVKILFAPAGAGYSWPFDPDEVTATRPREEWPVTRTYTVRAYDPVANELDVDFVVHGDEGLAGPWAAAARPGDEIGFHGPGGAWAPDPDAEVLLLVGDEAALPAIAAALEVLPGTTRAVAFLEIAGPGHEQALPAADRCEVTWVHRGRQPYGRALAAAVRAAPFPVGNVEAFVHGNAEMVRDLRRYLFLERGLARTRVSISGYWRTGQTEDRWQSTKREFNEQMEADERAAGG